MPPLVTVMMPVRDGAEYIDQAIESILSQTYANVELIICDDSSSDGTRGIIRKYAKKNKKVRILENRAKRGIPKTRNKILRQAKGEFVCHIDADDFVSPEAIESMVESFEIYPDTVLAYSDCMMVNALGESIRELPALDPTEANMARLGWKHLGMYRTAVSLEIGGFNEKLVTCSDGDLFMRLAKDYPIRRVPKFLYSYRSHKTNVGHGRPKCNVCEEKPVCNYYRIWSEYRDKWRLSRGQVAEPTRHPEGLSLPDKIEKLISANPYNMSTEEYAYIAQRLEKAAPCNFLIFGCGLDSGLWRDVNQGGRTVFLENDQTWLDRAIKSFSIEGYRVDYATNLRQWVSLLEDYSRGGEPFTFELPKSLRAVKWDMVLVDAPAGYAWDLPGRMESIHAAYKIAQTKPGIDVFIHDINRKVESIYSMFFFGRQNTVSELGKLRHFRF